MPKYDRYDRKPTRVVEVDLGTFSATPRLEDAPSVKHQSVSEGTEIRFAFKIRTNEAPSSFALLARSNNEEALPTAVEVAMSTIDMVNGVGEAKIPYQAFKPGEFHIAAFLRNNTTRTWLWRGTISVEEVEPPSETKNEASSQE